MGLWSTTGKPRLFCKIDYDDDKNNPLIKSRKTPARLLFFFFYIPMLQSGSTTIIVKETGNSGFRSRTGKLEQISLQSLHTLNCSVIWNIANAMADREVRLTWLIEKYGWEKSICLSYCCSPEIQTLPVLQLFWLRIIIFPSVLPLPWTPITCQPR